MSEENSRNRTILIVDDSTSLRQVVAMTLKGQGYEVLEGCDGRMHSRNSMVEKCTKL